MKALVLAPYDGTLVMENANTMAKVIAEMLERENFQVDVIEGGDVKRENLPKKSYDLIVYVGHGTAKTLWPNGEPLFDESNASYFKGAIVLAIACESAKWLGMTAITSGATGYVGFKDVVYIPLSSDDHAYLGDFTRTFLSLPLSLLEGYSLYQATEEFKELCLEYVAEYESKQYDVFTSYMQALMRHNALAAKYEGKPASTLGEESFVVRMA